MKLYFYLLDDFKTIPTIREDVVEVVEKPKTYKPAEMDIFPRYYYNTYARKDDIGVVKKEFQKVYLIMDKNDKEEVKKLFNEYIDFVISEESFKIKQSEKTIETYRNARKMLEDWRSEDE